MKKIVAWWKAAGFTNIGYIGGAVAAFVLGQTHIASGLFAIAIYLNWNVIRKIVKGVIS